MTTPESQITFEVHELDFALEDSSDLNDWLLAIAREEERAISQLEYIFCSDEYLLELNKKYLSHDYYTDILTFPLQESPLEATIYISVERVKENAQLYKTNFIDEMHRVIAHGLLHLIGYNDKTQDDEQNMRLKENSCLEERTFI